MGAQTLDSKGITIEVDAQGALNGPNGFVLLPGITALNGPNLSVTEYQTTDFQDEAHTKAPGLPNWGDVSVTLFANSAAYHERLLHDMVAKRSVRNWRIEREMETLLSAGTLTERGVALAAPAGGQAAVATFGGTDYSDIRNVDLLGVGATLKVGTQYVVIIRHDTATTARVVTLDGTASVSQANNSVYSVIRPKTSTTFRGWVGSLSPSRTVDENVTNELSIMVTGTVTRAVTSS